MYIPKFTIETYYKYYLFIILNKKTNKIGDINFITELIGTSKKTAYQFVLECINLKIFRKENLIYYIDMQELYQDKLLDLKNVSCLYRLYKNDTIVYVGKTKDAYSRIKSHKTDKDFDSFDFCCLDSESDRNIYEIYYIAHLKPLYNKESKHIDIPTIFLDDLKFSQLIFIK